MRIASLAFLWSITSTAAENGEHLGSQLCRCIGAQYVKASGVLVRDGTELFSTLVPETMEKIDHGNFESRAVEWRDDRQSITSSYFLRGTGGRMPAAACELLASAGKILVSAENSGKANSVEVVFDSVPGSRRQTLMLRFSGTDRDKACSIASNTVASLTFLGDWTTVSVLRISSDRKSFVYRDGAGSEHVGKVGSFVTRDNGRVIAIHADSIELIELEETDDAARQAWRERPRSIQLTTH